MQDRNVEFPNRFRMVKVEGTDDIYDVIPAPGDVVAEGDTFSKANILPDSIPALLGLKMANPQVKDALDVLANIGNVHAWSRTITLSESVPAYWEMTDFGDFVLVDANDSYKNWQASADIAISDAGQIALGPTSIVSLSVSAYSQASALLGKYVQNGEKTYYFPTTATYGLKTVGGVNSLVMTGTKLVTGYPMIPAGTHTDFVTSTDFSAYPQDGDVGDYHYTYLGQLGDPGVKIEELSYVGTGTCGIDNPCSVTASGKIMALIYCGYSPGAPGYFSHGHEMFAMFPWNLSTDWTQNGGFTTSEYTEYDYGKKSADGKTFSWYQTYKSNAGYQLNDSGKTYHFLAIVAL